MELLTTQKSIKKFVSLPPLNLDASEETTFTIFYGQNKKQIFTEIVNLFEYFVNPDVDYLCLHISAEINGCPWEHEENFFRTDTELLDTAIRPYFEHLEEFEKCYKIKNLYSKLK